MYPNEELARAMIREREREVRELVRHSRGRPRSRRSFRSRLARYLACLALFLDAEVVALDPAWRWYRVRIAHEHGSRPTAPPEL